jgi:hypothetical protein
MKTVDQWLAELSKTEHTALSPLLEAVQRDALQSAGVDTIELRARRDAEGWVRADPEGRDFMYDTDDAAIVATQYGSRFMRVDAPDWPALCRALKLPGWEMSK